MYESKDVIDVSRMSYDDYCWHTGNGYRSIESCGNDDIDDDLEREPKKKRFKRRVTLYDIFIHTPLCLFFGWPLIKILLTIIFGLISFISFFIMISML